MRSETDWALRGDVWGEPTDWSLVADAGQARSGPDADQTWRSLLERYRRPLEIAARRRLRSSASAGDLVDSFFSYLYSKDVLARADPDRGRFRCFLQGVLKRYLAQEWRADRRMRSVPLNSDVPVVVTPEIERREEAEWAASVLKNAIDQLTRENPRGSELLLRAHGIPPWPATSTEALCAEHDLRPNALYQAVFRARRRLRELVLLEIRTTVLTEQDYSDEKDVIVGRLLEAYGHVFVEPG